MDIHSILSIVTKELIKSNNIEWIRDDKEFNVINKSKDVFNVTIKKTKKEIQFCGRILKKKNKYFEFTQKLYIPLGSVSIIDDTKQDKQIKNILKEINYYI